MIGIYNLFRKRDNVIIGTYIFYDFNNMYAFLDSLKNNSNFYACAIFDITKNGSRKSLSI